MSDEKIDVKKLRKMANYDASEYLKTEEDRQAFLDEFKNDSDEAKAHANSIVYDSRLLYPVVAK